MEKIELELMKLHMKNSALKAVLLAVVDGLYRGHRAGMEAWVASMRETLSRRPVPGADEADVLLRTAEWQDAVNDLLDGLLQNESASRE